MLSAMKQLEVIFVLVFLVRTVNRPRQTQRLLLAAYRLVRFLIETKGVETFMKLYGAEKPAVDIENL